MNGVIVQSVSTPSVSLGTRQVSGVTVQEVTSRGSATSLMPFVEADGSNLIFRMVTLQQMAAMTLTTSGGDVTFTLTTDDDNFYLNFSEDSPEAIAGQLIMEDSIDMLYYVFGAIIVPLPEGYTVSSVVIEGIDANLLESDITWRVADIQGGLSELGDKLGDYVLIESGEYSPALADLETRLT